MFGLREERLVARFAASTLRGFSTVRINRSVRALDFPTRGLLAPWTLSTTYKMGQTITPGRYCTPRLYQPLNFIPVEFASINPN